MPTRYFGQACTVFAWRAAHSAYWRSSSIAQPLPGVEVAVVIDAPTAVLTRQLAPLSFTF